MIARWLSQFGERARIYGMRLHLIRHPLGGRIGEGVRLGRSACILALALMSQGCLHTWTGRTYYYPDGTKRENSTYRVVLQFDGASGKAYTERTAKTIGIAIRSGDTNLLNRWYKLEAGDMDAGVTWKTADDLTIYFFEPGPYQSRALPRHELLRLHFTLDASTGQFVEAPLPMSDVEALNLTRP